MSFFEDMLPFLDFWGVREKTGVFTDSVTQMFMNSMTNNDCSGDHHSDIPNCRDESAALILKFAAMAAILLAGVCGITIPLVGKHRNFLKTDSNLFVAAKSFAGGVILATGFVHMLPDASNALTNPCLPKNPWSKFPFSGFVAMMASLGTLLVEFIGTQYYERKQGKPSEVVQVDDESLEFLSESGRVADHVESKNLNGKVFGEEEGGGMHIVGMHAHVAHHRHSHSQEHGACAGALTSHPHGGHSHTHGLIGENEEEQEGSKRHVVVSQVLELGIVSHSVIIGLSLGVSQSPCTIRPLVGALSFHQFFEGFALGGCISQAQFKTAHATVMACFFAITTPLGIAVGTGVSSIYNPNSPRALIIEGILDSISAGILVYMALVDLVAADFLSKRMSCNLRLQVASYIALFFGAALMSSLALWA